MTEARPIPDVGALSEAFIAELKHWREIAGVSQKGLAKLTGYTPSYLSKVECGALVPSRQFTEAADQHLRAGHAILRRWKALHEATKSAAVPSPRRPDQTSDELLTALSATLVVEHEDARLSYDDGVFRSVIRRQLTTGVCQSRRRCLARREGCEVQNLECAAGVLGAAAGLGGVAGYSVYAEEADDEVRDGGPDLGGVSGADE